MDPSSAAEPGARITHVELELTPNMETQVIYGRATYSYACSDIRRIVLDTNFIEILESTNPYCHGAQKPIIGRPLYLNVMENSGNFTISYKILPEATVLQFLSPKQTSGKVHGFCYTQCQPIHCRSLFPIPDTPSMKFTINYHISVPEGLKAVAAGIYQNTTSSIPGFNVYHFTQAIPVPSYLVAFAIGNIQTRHITPMINIYAEPEVIDAAASEFEDIEKLLHAAEEIMTPYFWNRLDLLVLPPSFPYGGMENPNLIFVTPTLLAGDKSLTSVVAHEIAHS